MRFACFSASRSAVSGNAFGAHFVDDFLHGAVDRPQRHDDGLRVLVPIAADQAAGRASEALVELLGQLRNERQRTQLLMVREVPDFGEGLGPHHRAHRHRRRRVEDLPRLERRQERIDLLLRGHVDAIVGVGEDEAIHAHHHRAGQFFSQPEGLDVQVERLLVGLREELDPAGVAHRHAVGVVVPDVDRCADGAVADRHHDGQAQSGGVVDRLRHEQQSLARRRRVGARARGRGADGHRQRGEFGLDVDELAIGERAVLHHLAHALDDVRLRGDRVGADHLRARQRDRLGDGVGTFDLLKHGGPPSPFSRTRTLRWRQRCSPRRSLPGISRAPPSPRTGD
jgi:hypothetical protein